MLAHGADARLFSPARVSHAACSGGQDERHRRRVVVDEAAGRHRRQPFPQVPFVQPCCGRDLVAGRRWRRGHRVEQADPMPDAKRSTNASEPCTADSSVIIGPLLPQKWAAHPGMSRFGLASRREPRPSRPCVRAYSAPRRRRTGPFPRRRTRPSNQQPMKILRSDVKINPSRVSQREIENGPVKVRTVPYPVQTAAASTARRMSSLIRPEVELVSEELTRS
jgi:hypothetical protein